MMPHHVAYQLAMMGRLGLCVLLHSVWPSRGAGPPGLPPLQRKRSPEPQPVGGLTQRPPGALGDHAANHREPPLPSRPAPLAPTPRRPRALAPSRPCCPPSAGDYRGWRGLGQCGPPAIPVAAPGDRATVRRAPAPVWRPTARSAPAKGWRWSGAGAGGQAGRRAWACGPRPGCLRVPPTPSCTGGGKRRSRARPAPPLCSVPSTGVSGPLTRGRPCGAASEMARAGPRTPAKRLERARPGVWTVRAPARPLRLETAGGAPDPGDSPAYGAPRRRRGSARGWSRVG